MGKVARRFIAGATCPVCHLVDKVYVEKVSSGGLKLRGCVSCGFEESLDKLEHQSEHGENKRTVNPGSDSDQQPVRLVLTKSVE